MTDGDTDLNVTEPEPGPEVGDELDLRVDAVAPGGHCVARSAGRVVFVRHALPGERVTGRVTEVRRGYLRADAVAVHEESPDRVEPPCEYAGPGGCGGCDWQHAAPAAQRRLKTAVLAELLERIGGLDPERITALDPTVRELPGGPLDWRTRVRYAVDDRGRAGFREHRSHHIVPVHECVIAAPALRALGVTHRAWRPGGAVAAVASSTGETRVVPAPPRNDRSRRRNPPPKPVPELTERAAGRRFAVPAEAFWQVHPAAADTLSAAVLELTGPRPGERAVDLYGGVGLFAASLAERVGAGGRVTLVESGRDAAAAARRNLAGTPQARVIAGRVERVLERLLESEPVDVAVVDPPRSGIGPAVAAALAASVRRAVCYVSCDPASFARDVRVFAGAGWRLEALRGYDAFPMTEHLECVGLLVPNQ